MKPQDYIGYIILISLILFGFYIKGQAGGLLSGFFLAIVISVTIGKIIYRITISNLSKKISNAITPEDDDTELPEQIELKLKD